MRKCPVDNVLVAHKLLRISLKVIVNEEIISLITVLSENNHLKCN